MRNVVVILCLLVTAATTFAATIDQTAVIPSALRSTDKIPLGRPGVTTAYTATMGQVSQFVQSQLSSAASAPVTTTAGITDTTDKRFVTDAQRTVLNNTSGTNSGNVSLGTANGLSLNGQVLSLGVATDTVPGALSAADHITFSTGATKASTALQPAAIGVTVQPYNGGTVTAITDSTSTVSGTTAASATAVKSAYDLANGKPSLTNTAPNMDGVASSGSGSSAARVDHVHPTDTTRAPIDNPTFTTAATSPVYRSSAPDGTRFTQPYNSTSCPTTCDGQSCEGALCTLADGKTYQYHAGTWGQTSGSGDLDTALGVKVDKNSTSDVTFANGVGPVLTALNGNKYRLAVDNSGNISTSLVSGALPPSAPTGHSTVAGNASITLHPGTAGGATSYKYYLRASSDPTTSIYDASGLATDGQTISSLTNGTTYKVGYTASNINGESVLSTIDTVTPSIWYLPGSTTTGQVEFAYNAKGAASYTASKSNLASPGTHDATDGAAYPTWANGTGWTFNGTSQYLLASTTSGATKPFTMIARVTLTDTTGNYTMIGGGTTGNATWRVTNTGTLELDSLNTSALGNSTGTATAGSSHVYAVTYSGTGVWTYYIDGVASGTGTNNVTFTSGVAHKIGTQTDSGNTYANWFKGSMQAVAKYGVALSSTDIATLSTAMAGL